MRVWKPKAVNLYTIYFEYPNGRKVVYCYNRTLQEANDILDYLKGHQKELQIPGTNPSYYDNPLESN